MYKVLVVEDETAYQKILKDTFEKEKFEVILTSEGKGALTEMSKVLPDVILLDIMLPGGMNGFDFLEQIKVNESTKNIPVIVITNLSSEEKVAKEIGATSYFVKSETTIEQIISKVKEVLGIKSESI
jgi:DNA-binding response OmpR family regulator